MLLLCIALLCVVVVVVVVIQICVYIYIYIYVYTAPLALLPRPLLILPGVSLAEIPRNPSLCLGICGFHALQTTHGSFLIRRQRGHPGVVLPLVISNSANHWEGEQLELSPFRNEPD